jgi:hypothetical protein
MELEELDKLTEDRAYDRGLRRIQDVASLR